MKKTATKPRKRAGARSAGPHAYLANGGVVDADERPLQHCVESALDAYFAALDGEPASGLFDLVMSEVEQPMLACVMRHVGGNQCRAAQALGLSRGTLRKKLLRHGLLDD